MEAITELVPPPRPWAALPRDLVGEISGHLRDAADFVSFHAVCRPWRKAAPSPAAIRPRFLPWPLGLCNDLLLHLPLNFGRISPSTTSRYGHGCDGVLLARASSSGNKNWVARADGTAAWFLTVRPEPTMADLRTGAITELPRFPENVTRRMERSRGIVYSDGTIFLHTIDRNPFTAAILRPGDVAWTIAEKSHHFGSGCPLSAAYHDGVILVCMKLQFWFVLTPDFHGNGGAGGGSLEMMSDPSDAMKLEYSYVFESGNELMWATVMSDQKENNRYLAGYDPTSTLSVTLHALVGTSSGDKLCWMARDGQSLRGRALFLGSPASFTVDATPLGVGGGCAYFVFKSSVFRYNLIDGVAELMERAPSGWGSDKAHVWLQPHPAIAPIQEIRGKLKVPRKKKDKKIV